MRRSLLRRGLRMQQPSGYQETSTSAVGTSVRRPRPNAALCGHRRRIIGLSSAAGFPMQPAVRRFGLGQQVRSLGLVDYTPALELARRSRGTHARSIALVRALTQRGGLGRLVALELRRDVRPSRHPSPSWRSGRGKDHARLPTRVCTLRRRTGAARESNSDGEYEQNLNGMHAPCRGGHRFIATRRR